MIRLIYKDDSSLKDQMEFLLCREIPLSAEEVNTLAHLCTGNSWVIKVLDKLNLTIDDIVYKYDRDILRMEINKK